MSYVQHVKIAVAMKKHYPVHLLPCQFAHTAQITMDHFTVQVEVDVKLLPPHLRPY